MFHRIPTGDAFEFGVSSIFVFFSRQGLLFLLLLFVTFAAGTNYANNLILGLFFYLVSLILVSAAVTFLQLSSIKVRLQEAGLGQSGGLIWVTIEVSNRAGAPSRQVSLSFYGDDFVADGLCDEDKVQFDKSRLVRLTALKEPTVIRLPIIAKQRGWLALPKLRLVTTYPLGVIKAWGYGAFISQALAYPTPQKPPKTPKGVHISDEVGADMVSGQNDFDRLDTYQEGESLARVSWGHMARGMGMLSKHFADGVSTACVFDYAHMPATDHEGKLSQLCHLVLDANAPFALHLPTQKTEVGFGDDFVRQCLIRLAKEP